MLDGSSTAATRSRSSTYEYRFDRIIMQDAEYELRRKPQRVEKLRNVPLEAGSRTQRPFSAVFWPWSSGVGFVLDLPTGQIATLSTG